MDSTTCYLGNGNRAGLVHRQMNTRDWARMIYRQYKHPRELGQDLKRKLNKRWRLQWSGLIDSNVFGPIR